MESKEKKAYRNRINNNQSTLVIPKRMLENRLSSLPPQNKLTNSILTAFLLYSSH